MIEWGDRGSKLRRGGKRELALIAGVQDERRLHGHDVPAVKEVLHIQRELVTPPLVKEGGIDPRPAWNGKINGRRRVAAPILPDVDHAKPDSKAPERAIRDIVTGPKIPAGARRA